MLIASYFVLSVIFTCNVMNTNKKRVYNALCYSIIKEEKNCLNVFLKKGNDKEGEEKVL
jgi:hypothetical protein